MRLTGLLYAIFLTIFSSGSFLHAANSDSQRLMFVTAEKALQHGKTTAYQLLKSQLENYPLYPYLQYQELSGRLSQQTPTSIQQFINSYPNSVLAERLRDRWLNYLAKHRRWSDYLRFYEQDWSTIRHCHYLTALVKTGKAEQAYPEIEALWLYPKSRPDACDPAFAALAKADRISSDLAWQRISLAINKGQTQLALYLSRWLDSDDKGWVERWVRAHRNPDSVMHKSAFKQAHPYRETILSHGIQRQARSDPLQAVRNWKILQQRYTFSPLIQMLTERQLALRMFRNPSPEAYQYLTQFAACSHDTHLQETRLRAALIKQDWGNMIRWIDELPEQLKGSERWRYWQGRALAESNQQDAADKIFAPLAEERSYYGYLAADQLAIAYNIGQSVTPVSDQAMREVQSIPAVIRAHELVLLSRWRDARREWRQATSNMPRSQMMAAAKLAQSWQWHDQAIFTLAKTGYWEDLALRFPLEHKNQVSNAAKKTGLDMEWIYAVIRQESAFNASVRSSAGAIGLMQLMPATAKNVSVGMLKQSAPSRAQLKQPTLNIRLGSTYLNHVLNKLNKNPVLATAAYNAGPHRVSRWLPEKNIPADIWIELIPFKETQNYVKRVMTYAVIYNNLLQQDPVRMATRMPMITANKS